MHDSTLVCQISGEEGRNHEPSKADRTLDLQQTAHFCFCLNRSQCANHSTHVCSLRTACETVKRELTSASQASTLLPSVFEGVDYVLSITRER